MTERAKALLRAARDQLYESLFAEERARELVWRVSREEGVSFADMAAFYEQEGDGGYNLVGIRAAVREQDDENAQTYDFRKLAEREWERFRRRDDDDA